MPTAGETVGILLGAVALTAIVAGVAMHGKKRRDAAHELYYTYPRYPYFGWQHPDIDIHLPEAEP